MSLNGLNDAKVTEAYTGALGEAGGWFLLKYASRDSVEILTRGTGGAAEARAAIAGYEETSPLYGFLLYRRRKVLVKYVPDGTSRLLQARVAVHFTAVTEKFTPYDTTFSITTADELSDAALTSACSLHTAAPSSSSSSASSRKQKLDEITEDVEDGQSTAGESASTARPSTAKAAKATAAENVVAAMLGKEAKERTLAEQEREKTGEDTKAAPETSHVTTETAADRHELSRSETAPSRDSYKNYDSLFENGPDPRSSSQTTRPELSELYAELYAQYNKPKVKLGPRPKASLDIKRPHTSGSGTQSAARPVSSLPAGLRASSRKGEAAKRSKSKDATAAPSVALPPPPPIPTLPDTSVAPMHAPRSPASVRSLPLNTFSSLNHKSSGVTPEKQRLMRAVQLRKKQMEARKESEETQPETETMTEDTVAGAVEGVKDAEGSTANATEDVTGSASVPGEALNEPRGGEESASEQQSSNTETNEAPSTRENSAVGMTRTRTEPDDMHSAASASSPISAQTQGSSCAPSTRPSSISEDDNQHSEEGKIVTVPEFAVRMDKTPTEDEGDSVESTPTIVPNSPSPIPLVEVSRQADETTAPTYEASASDHLPVGINQPDSAVPVSPSDWEDTRTSRKSKRASMLLSLSSEGREDAQTKARKRETVILSLPQERISAEDNEARQLAIDPMHLSAENSEAEYLSDDSFMEELQSAKFEEAMPVSVSSSRSPVTPFFPRKSPMSEVPVTQRSASQQHIRLGRTSPEQPVPRKLSGPWLTHSNSDTVVVAKKINVSSGISQRIKALAEKSNRDSASSLSPAPTPESIVAQRKSSFFSTSPDGNSPNGKSMNRIPRPSFVNVSRSTTPEPKQVVQSPSATTPSKQGTGYRVQQEPEQPEQPKSVQVTARIVRNLQVQNSVLPMPTERSPLELHHSPLTIDHQKSLRQPSSPVKAEPTSSRPPSSSRSIDPASTLPRSSSESSWRSFGRRHSESKSGGAPRSMSSHSFDSSDEKQEKKDKKSSRTSKLFKRMSSSITRKNSAASSTLPQEDVPPIPLPSLREPPSSVQIGDLNIQFPDTLLWKRRWVEIDSVGNLVLSLSKSNEQSKGITRRFNLTEFQTPYAPDQDRQELPNSVVLDFLDGRTLQCACGSYAGQVQVLQILQETHSAWVAYNQGL